MYGAVIICYKYPRGRKPNKSNSEKHWDYNRRNITEWNMLIKSKSCVLVIVDTELLMQRYRLLVTKI